MPRAPRAQKTPQTVHLYLDYNGVLNTWGLLALKVFMEKLTHADALNLNHGGVVRITLLSYRRRLDGCHYTLQELAEAGVLNMFHDIVFTAERSGYEGGDLQLHTYDPHDYKYNRHDRRSPRCQADALAMMLDNNDCNERTYHWFTSGKDAYIAQHHGTESTRIIFADDNCESLETRTDGQLKASGLSLLASQFV